MGCSGRVTARWAGEAGWAAASGERTQGKHKVREQTCAAGPASKTGCGEGGLAGWLASFFFFLFFQKKTKPFLIKQTNLNSNQYLNPNTPKTMHRHECNTHTTIYLI
jgi:hypothetical protein